MSWLEDADQIDYHLPYPSFDDEPVTPTRRRPIEVSPGVWIYPEFLERLEANSTDPFHAAASWRSDEF